MTEHLSTAWSVEYFKPTVEICCSEEKMPFKVVLPVENVPGPPRALMVRFDVWWNQHCFCAYWRNRIPPLKGLHASPQTATASWVSAHVLFILQLPVTVFSSSNPKPTSPPPLTNSSVMKEYKRFLPTNFLLWVSRGSVSVVCRVYSKLLWTWPSVPKYFSLPQKCQPDYSMTITPKKSNNKFLLIYKW